MKKTFASICVGIAIAGTVLAWFYWHQQRQKVRSQLIAADEAVRTLDEYSEQQYTGGPTMDLTQADLRARDKLNFEDGAYHTVKENACAVILGFELGSVEAHMSSRQSLYSIGILEAEKPANSGSKAKADPFKLTKQRWPVRVTKVAPCIDELE